MSPRPPHTETIRFLTLDEFSRPLPATRGSVRDCALFLLDYRHGLRASEVGLLPTEGLDLRALRLVCIDSRAASPARTLAAATWLRRSGPGCARGSSRPRPSAF